VEVLDSKLVLESIFVPDTSLQGTDIPVHIIWKKDAVVKHVKVCYPNHIMELEEIYNVNKDGIHRNESCIIINGSAIEVNGYIGLVFKSEILKEPYVETEISIEIMTLLNSSEKTKWRLKLFRPHLVVQHIPPIIEIKVDAKGIKLSDRIVATNKGFGIAIVKFEVKAAEEVKVLRHLEIKEYVEHFCNQLLKNLEKVKTTFPQYSSIVNEFGRIWIDLSFGTFKITKESLKHAKEVFLTLLDIIEGDEDFARAITTALLGAYFSAINILTEFRALLEYLNSLAENRIILINAMDIIELQPGTNIVNGELQVHDLAENVYKPISIRICINVKCNDKIMIPLYELFKWK